jgi:hypothetical protein
MLPNADYRPPECLQLSGAAPVASSIQKALVFPVRSVILRESVALRTAVPKAPVDKNRQLLGAKHEVRFSRQVPVSAPAREACLSQQTNERALCGFVAFRSNARHIMRALLRSEPVCHFSASFLVWPNLFESLLKPG